MNVEVDSKEKSRIKPALFFFGQNNTVSVSELEIGDYLFINEDNTKKCVFEYKTCEDYINSVIENKIFNQAINQTSFDYHFVIIEYTDEERKRISDKLYYRNKISFSKKQFYTSIARLNTFTTVLTAEDNRTCFELMEYQAKKCFDEKEVYKRLRRVNDNPCFNYLTMNCHNVGEVTAKTIVDELNLNTLSDLLKINKEDLMDCKGVGEVTADNILCKIDSDR